MIFEQHSPQCSNLEPKIHMFSFTCRLCHHLYHELEISKNKRESLALLSPRVLAFVLKFWSIQDKNLNENFEIWKILEFLVNLISWEWRVHSVIPPFTHLRFSAIITMIIEFPPPIPPSHTQSPKQSKNCQIPPR